MRVLVQNVTFYAVPLTLPAAPARPYIGMAVQYSYERLSSLNSTRFLLLEPALEVSEPLRGALVETELTQSPQYHALSYVWGEVDPDCPDFIELKDSTGSYAQLVITSNCASALRHLRESKEQKTIWVDAVCIDQKSDLEKSHQVQFMELVYYNASQVDVWLDLSGISARKIRQCLRIINRLGFLFKKKRLSRSRRNTSDTLFDAISVQTLG